MSAKGGSLEVSDVNICRDCGVISIMQFHIPTVIIPPNVVFFSVYV